MPKQVVLENVIVPEKFFLEVVELALVTQNNVLEIRFFQIIKFNLTEQGLRNCMVRS